VNIHCTIVRQHLQQPGYLEQFLAFWSEQSEVNRIWFSVYTPQRGESSAEKLLPEDRLRLAARLPGLSRRFPKLMLPDGMAKAFSDPPKNPGDCLFAKMSVNYTADLRTNVEPCVFGGDPDCSRCGCSASAGLHWIGGMKIAGPFKIKHLVRASLAAGTLANRVFPHRTQIPRWSPPASSSLVQIDAAPEDDCVDAFKK
jgi:hypothetical protein